jgi:Cu-Zn family superoxide dismutase
MKSLLAVGVAACLAAACSSMGGGGASGPKAVARLDPTKGNEVRGTVTFTQRGDSVHVDTVLTGLSPGSQHGIHVHEKGDCSAPDGTSAGGHYNPKGVPHGPQSGAHHEGDMPNIQAGTYGGTNASFDIAGVKVEDLVGKAVIVHRDADDYASQPAGNSGPRIACGVIQAA